MADYDEFFFEAEVATSFVFVVRSAGRDNTPEYGIQEWSMFASFSFHMCLLSLVAFFGLYMSEWCCVVSISCFEVVFSKSNLCFRGVVFFAFNISLVNDWWLEAISVKWAWVKLSTVACLIFFRTVYFIIVVDWWIEDELVVVVNDVFDVAHSTVAYFDCVGVKHFFWLLRIKTFKIHDKFL